MNHKVNKIYLWHYFLALITATFLFSVVFLLAYSVSYFNYIGITNENEMLNKSLVILDEYIKNFSCDNIRLVESSQRLDAVGIRVNLLETRFGKNDKGVLNQKKYYTELEYKHFTLVKKFIEQCDANMVPIIFFYTNNKEYKEKSERMGDILRKLKSIYNEKAMIYSFDYLLDSDVIKVLKESYNITDVPVVFVGEKEIFVRNINDIERFVK